jgi:hypothetical protein
LLTPETTTMSARAVVTAVATRARASQAVIFVFMLRSSCGFAVVRAFLYWTYAAFEPAQTKQAFSAC